MSLRGATGACQSAKRAEDAPGGAPPGLKTSRLRPDSLLMGAGRKAVWGLSGVVVATLALTAALVAPFRWLPPPTTAFIEQARLERAVHYRWVPWEQISSHLAVCVVTAEDQLFPLHTGFDVASIRSALEEKRKRSRGASTISQQVAKNLYLWPGRSFVRKGLEAWLTVWIEALWPKRRILEVYLNIAEFGPGIFGAGAASQQLFGKPPAQLTLEEASLLAAVLPNPSRMHANRPSEYVQGRAAEIQYSVNRWGDRFRRVL